MIGKTSVWLSALLLLSLVFIPLECSPLQKNAENRPPALNNRESRTFGFNLFGSNNWPYFRQTWRLPTLTFFDDEHENFHKRIADLEYWQRRIMNQIRRLQEADKKASGQSTAEQPERLPASVVKDSDVPPATPANASTEFAPEPQIPSTSSTATPAVTADNSAVVLPQEQQVVVATTTAATRLVDETTEAMKTITTIGNVSTESSGSADKLADKDVEAVTESIASSEELMKEIDEMTTRASKDDSEETNELFV